MRQGFCKEMLKQLVQTRMLSLRSMSACPNARSSSLVLFKSANTKRVAVRGPTPGRPRKCWINRVIGGGKFICVQINEYCRILQICGIHIKICRFVHKVKRVLLFSQGCGSLPFVHQRKAGLGRLDRCGVWQCEFRQYCAPPPARPGHRRDPWLCDR